MSDIDSQWLLTLAEAKVSPKTGLLKDVHLVGVQAVNKINGKSTPYTYKEAALAEAIPLYENADVNIGHESGKTDPSVLRKIGFVVPKTLYVKEGKGLFGDIQLNTEHPSYRNVMWWAEHNPTKLGMSHIARAKYHSDENAIVKIIKVASVDFVSNPSTTDGLFKEGIIADTITLDDEANKLSRVLSTAQDLIWKAQYPITSMSLTNAEKADKILPIIRDLSAELKTIAATKVKESAIMDWTSINLEELTKHRPDVIKVIESAAVERNAAFETKVSEALKDVPQQLQSEVFIRVVRESIAAGKDVSDIVADRKALNVVVAESTGVVPPKVIDTKEAKKALTVDDVTSIALKK